MVKLKGEVTEINKEDVFIEFKPIQANLDFATLGKINKELKLKLTDKVIVTIERG